MALIESPISPAAARSVQGPGIRNTVADYAVTTTKTFFDLTAWEGRPVIIQITGAARWRWAQAAGDTLDVATEQLDAAVGVTDGAGILPAPGEYPKVVPRRSPATNSAKVGLLIAAAAGSIDVVVSTG